jgi:hypothetical protein
VIFSSNIIKTPKSSRDGAKKNKKTPKVSSNKGEVNILRGERHLKNPFQCDPIFSPSIIPFQKPFPTSLRNFSKLFLDHPLAWQYA